MKRLFCLALSVLLMLCALPCPAAAESAFTDVDPEAWYAPYIDVCVEAGVMEGVGDGRFEPEDSLSCREGTVMLLRLYDVLHGGNGVFPTSPEDWVPVWVEDEQGQALFNAEDYAGWHSGHGEYSLFFHSRQPQALAGTTGVVRLGGRAFSGVFSVYETSIGVVAMLDLSAYDHLAQDDTADAFHTAEHGANWVKRAWYYAQRNGLDDMVRLGDTHTYQSFAAALEQVCSPLPARFQAEYVPGFEREEDPAIYALREAGIWKELNEAQTPYLGNTYIISRANAAILMARVLEPELRLTEDPTPLPHVEYTLTYLMDEPFRVPATYPVIPLEDGLLTISGEMVPWPTPWGETVPWPQRLPVPLPGYCTRHGESEYLRIAFAKPSRPIKTNRSGGGAVCSVIPDFYGWVDGSGQLVGSVFSNEQTPPPESPVFERPYSPSKQGVYYDAEGRPVSQKFDWCGDLNRDLQGFVGQEGKIYRIEFTR